MQIPWPTLRRLAAHLTVLAASRARASVGRRMLTRMAMIPMTTSSSTSVNPPRPKPREAALLRCDIEPSFRPCVPVTPSQRAEVDRRRMCGRLGGGECSIGCRRCAGTRAIAGAVEPLRSYPQMGLNPIHTPRNELTRLRRRAADLEEAVASYRDALLAGGPDMQIAFDLAHALHQLGRREEAAER